MPAGRMIKGYLAACAAAAVTVSILTAIVIAATESDSQIVLAIVAMLLGVPLGFAIASIAALPGAIAIVVIAHIGGFDSRAYYTMGGTLTGLLVAIRMALDSDNGDFSATNMSTYVLPAAIVLAGGVAGFTYWYVAVRERGTEDRATPRPKGWDA